MNNYKFLLLFLIPISFNISSEFKIGDLDRKISEQPLVSIDLKKGNSEKLSYPLQKVSLLPKLAKKINLIGPEFNTRGGPSVYSRVAPTVVKIFTETSSGSGAVISKDGRIVTNWHVIEGNEEVGVIFLGDAEKNPKDPVIYIADVIKVDPKIDLSIIKLRTLPAKIKVISYGSLPKIGEDVHAIGHPEGEDWTYTRGYVSQIRSKYEWRYEKSRHKADVIQTQTPINPGNSGGPLVDNKGKLVGINTTGGKGEGLNFSVSVNEVRNFNNSRKDIDPKIIDETALTACIDRNEDGINDTCGYDLDGDGITDAISYDLNFDGNIDETILVEMKGDELVRTGRIQAVELDGVLVMLWLVDLDGDNESDVYGYDYDRDGRPDSFNSFDS